MKKYNRHGRPKGKNKFHITYEILPPGSLKRTSCCTSETPEERWEEIINIGAEIIAENGSSSSHSI